MNKFNPKDIQGFTFELSACLVAQRTYGRQGDDIEALVEIFLEDLKEFPPEKVIQAIRTWRKKDPNFPTVADLIKILNPKPVLNTVVYISIQEKKKSQGGSYLTQKEWDYMAAYEKEYVG